MVIYRFYLTIGSTVTEVFPLNFLESALVDEQAKNEAFYRRTFQGTLQFTNNNGANDFDLLYAAEVADPCQEILLSIERMGDPYWNGFFSTTDGNWDLDHCTFDVIPQPDDDYAIIYDRMGIQYNMLTMDDPATGITYPSVTTTAEYIDGDIIYTRNRWLLDILEFLCDVCVAGATYSSEFFTNATNPATLNDNLLLYLTIAQKSDIKRPASTDPATVAMISLKELLDIFWIMFQVQWYYDPVANEFIIEHVSSFAPGAGMDLRTQEIAKNNRYSYQKEEMPKYEKFYFAEADNINFVGVPIYYESKCVNQDPETNILEKRINVTTDLEYIIENVDAIADEGFVIFCNYVDGGNYFVKLDYGALGNDVRLNTHLSWANLNNCYYRHNRILIDGWMNNLPRTFWSAQKVKLQECFAVVCPDDNYDADDYLATELGETWFSGEKAKVKRSELSPSGEMKFNLIYGPADNINTGVITEKGILIEQIGADSFRATLTEPADAELDINLNEDIYDDGCAWQCTGAPETWTIHAGERTSTFTFADLCTPMLAGWFNLIFINGIGAPGWNINFVPDPDFDFDTHC